MSQRQKGMSGMLPATVCLVKAAGWAQALSFIYLGCAGRQQVGNGRRHVGPFPGGLGRAAAGCSSSSRPIGPPAPRLPPPCCRSNRRAAADYRPADVTDSSTGAAQQGAGVLAQARAAACLAVGACKLPL